MKQVTGATNNKPEIKNVSIRLRLDGHSFSEEKLDIPAKEKKTVEIEVLTGKTMLVPREVFDAKAAPALMRINGMEPTEKECILTSDPPTARHRFDGCRQSLRRESPCPAEGEDTLDLPVATYRGIHGILPLDIPL